ncbi:MAG: hypothetical protein O7I42_02520 [Alphaproteobacteria bacterium]|nr:hypothetical protein [Alphaproteobacteria bacterium]
MKVDFKAIVERAIHYQIEGLSRYDMALAVLKDFPDVTLAELKEAFQTYGEVLHMEAREQLAEGPAMKLAAALVKQAQAESGQPNMNMGEGLAYLAEKGNTEAQAFLDEMTGPGARAIRIEADAAAKWHPGWKYIKHGQWHCTEGCEDDTIEKLLYAYRQHKRNA